jgi:hypothetical protein
MTTSLESSVLDGLSTEQKAHLAAEVLREKAESERIRAQEADRVKERVFKSTLASIKMYTTIGTPVVFVNHLHITNIPEVIEYLEKEIKRGSKDVRIDPEEIFFDADRYDPQKSAYKQARADLEQEYAARLAAVTDPKRDMGTSVQGRLTPASTSTIGAVAAGGGPAGIPNIVFKK